MGIALGCPCQSKREETVAAEATAHPKELEGVLEKAQDILHRSRRGQSVGGDTRRQTFRTNNRSHRL